MGEFKLWPGGPGFLPALAKAGVMLGDAARRKCCDTRALDLLISVGTGIPSHGMGSHKSLGRL